MFEALKAAVEERMKLARAVVPDNGTPEWQIVRDEEGYLHPAVADMNGIRMANGGDRTLAFFAANDPAFVLRQCERDLKVLERHAPVDVWAGWEHLPAPDHRRVVAVECGVCVVEHESEFDEPMCLHTAAPYPCPDIRDLAEVYQINLGVSDDS